MPGNWSARSSMDDDAAHDAAPECARAVDDVAVSTPPKKPRKRRRAISQMMGPAPLPAPAHKRSRFCSTSRGLVATCEAASDDGGCVREPDDATPVYLNADLLCHECGCAMCMHCARVVHVPLRTEWFAPVMVHTRYKCPACAVAEPPAPSGCAIQ